MKRIPGIKLFVLEACSIGLTIALRFIKYCRYLNELRYKLKGKIFDISGKT